MFSLDIAEVIQWFLSLPEWKVYLFVLLLMTVESSFIPFPSEIVVPPAAYWAVKHGGPDALWLVLFVLLAATAGAALGAMFNYGLSWWLGRPIVYRFADSRLGHLCLINREKVERSERYFDEHGAVATLVGRLVPVIRQLISIPAGLAKMHFGKFLVFTVLGAGLWNLILATLGYVLGRALPPDLFMAQIERYNAYISDGILVVVAAALCWALWHAYRRRSRRA